MTFGAVPAWLGWLILAAAGALAVRLFLVKLRPPRMFIPSLLLWRRVLDDAREQTLWERIRRAVSLVVTVVIALALALAAVRPGRTAGGGGQATGRLLIVLDSSLSMEARTGRGETRWARGVAEARRLFASSSGAELALATTADGLVEGPTADLALLESALDRVRPGGGDAAAWPRLAGASAVHFITDGAAARTIDAAVTVHTVFEPADNVGITALEVRPSLTPGTAGDAYLEVGNYAAARQKVRLRVTRGGVDALDRDFEMGPSEVMRQVIPVPQGGDAALQVHVEAPKNALEADDTAFAWVARSRPIAVIVVGERTEWLREAFSRDSGVRATFLAPSNWTGASAAARTDLVIFDRWAPREMPTMPVLLFAPPAAQWLTTGDAGPVPVGERRPRWEVPGSHPVVQGVDPFTLTIEHARAYSRPSLVPVAQTARGTPLVYVDESSGSRLVLVTFGVHESNLTSAPGFPVLLGNALEWLARPSFFATAPGVTPPASVRPGLVTLTATVQRLTGPDKAPVALTRVSDTVFAVLKQPGLYTVEAGRARDTFAVNVADPQLSNLTRTSAFASTRGRPVTAGSSAWAWWVYCAVAAFALAIAEWWTWQRRITV